MMIDADRFVDCPGIPVGVKDTIGAGDSFTAAVVMGKLYGLPLEKINQAASMVAAYVCSQPGATPILPSYLIAELKQQIPIRDVLDIGFFQKIQNKDFRKTNLSHH